MEFLRDFPRTALSVECGIRMAGWLAGSWNGKMNLHCYDCYARDRKSGFTTIGAVFPKKKEWFRQSRETKLCGHLEPKCEPQYRVKGVFGGFFGSAIVCQQSY